MVTGTDTDHTSSGGPNGPDRPSGRLLLVLLIVLAVSVGAGATAPAVSASGHAEATVVEVYPDTYESQNDGEYVALEFDSPTRTSGWTLGDGSDEMELPNKRLEGTVYFVRQGDSGNLPVPDGARHYELGLRLAASGDDVVLRNSRGRRVDEVRYGDEASDGVRPSEGDVLTREGDGATALGTLPYGGTEFEPLRTDVSGGTAFAVPDAGTVVGDEFGSAQDRLLVGAYTFGSEHLGDILVKKAGEGVGVSVLAESTPPGGFERPTENVFDDISDTPGLDVFVADGDDSRYRFFHAKYAVIDGERSIITTENWEDRNFAPEAGGSRGWGVVLEDKDTAEYLGNVFEEDVDWRAVSDWDETDIEGYEQDRSENPPRNEHEPREFNGGTAEVFVAPDSAVEPVVSLIEEADEEVLVQQAYIRAWDEEVESNPYASALMDGAKEGVEVRVMLDGRWFSEEENREVADALDTSDENLTARVADGSVHTKGVVVDNESVLVSSINWNENSPTDNRETGVVIHNEEAARYFWGVFQDDWEGDGEGVEGSERAGGGERDDSGNSDAGVLSDGGRDNNDDGDTDSGGPDEGIEGDDAAPTDYVPEIVVIAVVSGIGAWIVARKA